MKIRIFKWHSPAFLAAFILTTLSACGGGGSDSGGGPAVPPPPAFTLFTTGLYSGNLTLVLEGEGLEFNQEPQEFVLEVAGDVAGSQQVRIAFAQFSGTSSILRDGSFSIPSGPFPLIIRSRPRGPVFSTCTGELLFDGVFASDSVSGTVTVTPFECDRAGLGPITGEGSFQATAGATKRRPRDTSPLTGFLTR